MGVDWWKWDNRNVLGSNIMLQNGEQIRRGRDDQINIILKHYIDIEISLARRYIFRLYQAEIGIYNNALIC